MPQDQCINYSTTVHKFTFFFMRQFILFLAVMLTGDTESDVIVLQKSFLRRHGKLRITFAVCRHIT